MRTVLCWSLGKRERKGVSVVERRDAVGFLRGESGLGGDWEGRRGRELGMKVVWCVIWVAVVAACLLCMVY